MSEQDMDETIARAVEIAKPLWGQTMFVEYRPGRPMRWWYKAIDDERFDGAIPNANAEAVAIAAIEAKLIELGSVIELGSWGDADCPKCEVATEDCGLFSGPLSDRLFVVSKALVDQIGEHQ